MTDAGQVLAAVGLALILQRGTILSRARDWFGRVVVLRELFHCAQCLGFWCGAAVVLLAWAGGGRTSLWLPLHASVAAAFTDACLDALDAFACACDRRSGSSPSPGRMGGVFSLEWPHALGMSDSSDREVVGVRFEGATATLCCGRRRCPTVELDGDSIRIKDDYGGEVILTQDQAAAFHAAVEGLKARA